MQNTQSRHLISWVALWCIFFISQNYSWIRDQKPQCTIPEVSPPVLAYHSGFLLFLHSALPRRAGWGGQETGRGQTWKTWPHPQDFSLPFSLPRQYSPSIFPLFHGREEGVCSCISVWLLTEINALVSKTVVSFRTEALNKDTKHYLIFYHLQRKLKDLFM